MKGYLLFFAIGLMLWSCGTTSQEGGETRQVPRVTRVYELDPGEYEAEKVALDQKLAQHPDDAEAYASRGYIWSKLGAHDSAMADFDQALRLEPENPYATLYVAMHLESREMLAASLNFFDRAVRLRPEDPYFHYCRGSAYYHQGKMEPACEAWQTQAALGDPNGRALVEKYCGGVGK